MTEVWDRKAYRRLIVLPDQSVITAYTKGALATALNRKVVTIRRWEQRGVLCHPRMRKGKGADDKRARYLYTRDQIEDMIKLCESEGIIQPSGRTPFSQNFITKAHEIMKRLPQRGSSG